MAVNYKELGLVNSKELFAGAVKGGYAIPAFNFNNLEQMQAIVSGCVEAKSPVILQVSSGARKYANQTLLRYLAQGAVEYAKELGCQIPIVLHLDHGDTFELCKSCIDSGFSSVMIDGSHHSYEKNIELTKQVVEYAHAHGVSVEAELGKLAGVEDDVKVHAADSTYTDPEEAARFVKESGCDSLAIAIGTSHGAYKFKGEAKLDFERLAACKKAINAVVGYDFPVVLHGSSSVPKYLVAKCNKFGGNLPDAQGVPEDMLNFASKNGVAKINIDTDLRLAMTSTIREFFIEHPEKFDPREYMGPGRTAVKELVMHKMKDVLGTAGHAQD